VRRHVARAQIRIRIGTDFTDHLDDDEPLVKCSEKSQLESVFPQAVTADPNMARETLANAVTNIDITRRPVRQAMSFLCATRR
jgi:hypothetical protein